MNRRLITVLLGLGLGIGTQAFGQSAIAPNVRSASAVAAAEQQTIRSFIQAQVKKLTSNDAAAQSEAREALVNAALGDPTPTAAFLDAYAKLLNEAMLGVAASDDLRARLNAAIITARVAAKTSNLALLPAAQKFTADAADPVVLWGLKGLRPLLLAQLRTAPEKAGEMLKSFVPAIKDNLKAPVTEAAYEALRLDILADRSAVTPQMLAVVIPVVQELVETRIALYATSVPDGPVVDALGTNFLVNTVVWQAQSPEQHTRTAQLLADMLTIAAARLNAETDRPRREAIIQAMRLVASGVIVVAQHGSQGAALASAAQPLTRVDSSMSADQVNKMIEDVVVQIMHRVPGVRKPTGNLRAMAAN